ncbi:hypothetical protein FQR65_LT10865 [Abscondita terminalis]|nr:hypothetical protein FQR65_LT10865 [Abscondita terminalis]
MNSFSENIRKEGSLFDTETDEGSWGLIYNMKKKLPEYIDFTSFWNILRMNQKKQF